MRLIARNRYRILGKHEECFVHLWTYLKDYKDKHEAKGNGFGYSLFGPDDLARTLSARYFKDGSEVLIAQLRKRPRRLTPRECARLMGFRHTATDHLRAPTKAA